MSRRQRALTRVPRADAAQPRGDGWVNATTGLGDIGRDKSMQTGFCVERVLQEDAERLWQGDDIVARAVETVPNEMFREGFCVEVEGDKALGEDIEARIRDLKLVEKVRTASYYRRAFGGAGILLGVNDGAQTLDTPLPESIYSLDYITVYTPRELLPHLYYTDPEHYGEISQYNLVPLWVAPFNPNPKMDTMQRVDASRIIRLEGTSITKRRMLSEGRGWGDSILTRVARVIANFQQGWQGLGVLLQDYATPTLKIENLGALLASSQPGDQSLAKRAAAVELCRSLARVVIIGKNEEYKREAVPMTGLADALDKLALRLAAALDMPVSLLMGESPAGLNATGDSELRWFFNQVAALQKRDLLPVLQPLVRLMFLDKVNGPGKEPDNWNIKFNPLWALSAKEQADLRYVVAQTDQIYINTGVLDAKMVAENRFGGDEYSPETKIEMDDWEKMAAEADAAQAEQDQQAHEQTLAQIAAKQGGTPPGKT